jgi:cytochrome b561
MRAALAHFLMLVFAIAILKAGWFMAHKPQQALRFFTFGTEPIFGAKLGTAWCKISGWIFVCGSVFGIVLYLILIPIDILHS